MGLMIFVNHAGYYPPWLPHTSWNGIHLADFVMPCFLFVLGVSIAIAIVPKTQCTQTAALLSKVLVRTGLVPPAHSSL
jgi:heparan-alpha-glucosaminide N-acetyltransferase